MAVDPTAGKNMIAVGQTGEKNATSFATYGADEPNANEGCCADTQPGPSTPSIPVPNLGGQECMQDTSGPHR